MIHPRSACTLTLILLAFAAPASADVIETASTRFDTALAEGGAVIDGPNQNDYLATYGLFSDLTEATASSGPQGGWGGVTQTSNVAPGVYTAEIETFSNAFCDGLDVATGMAKGRFEVDFTVQNFAAFHITGLASAFGAINGETSLAKVTIQSLTKGIASKTIASVTDEILAFDVSGTLITGNYRLFVDVVSAVDVSFESGMAEANAAVLGLTLTVTQTWCDLGNALAGTTGNPFLRGSGTLIGGTPVILDLVNALGNSSTTLVVGLAAANANFKGGVLVPVPSILFSGLPTSPTGTHLLTSTWPDGVPSETTLYFQHWIRDLGAPAGLAASNGMSATTP